MLARKKHNAAYVDGSLETSFNFPLRYRPIKFFHSSFKHVTATEQV